MTTSTPRTGPIDRQFNATLLQSPAKGGWTYVVMDGSADCQRSWNSSTSS